MVLFGQKCLFSCKNTCVRENLLFMDKEVVLGQKGLCSGKVVVFWQKRFYSGESDCIRIEVAVVGKIGCNLAK